MRPCYFLLFFLVSSQAASQQSVCQVASPYLSAAPRIEENMVVRLDDEEKRAEYALAIAGRVDLVLSPSQKSYHFERVRLSSLYTTMVFDPLLVKRYATTPGKLSRRNELRRRIYGEDAAGAVPTVANGPKIAAQLEGLLDDDEVRRLRQTDWLSEVPALIINRGPPSDFRDLMKLESDDGSVVLDERARQAAGLIALGERSLGIELDWISEQGARKVETAASIFEGLYKLQLGKTNLCSVTLKIKRPWLDLGFVERYALLSRSEANRASDIVEILDSDSIRQRRNWDIFSFIESAYIVSAVHFIIIGDKVVLRSFLLDPLLSSQRK